MAELPTVRGPSVRDSGTTAGYAQTSVSPDQLGAQEGRALSRLAGVAQQGLVEYQNFRMQEDRVNSQNTALDAVNKLNDQKREAFYGPNGFLSRRGQSAQNVRMEAQAFMDDLGKQQIESITDPQARKAFQKLWSREREAALDSTARYEMGEMQTAKVQAQQGTLANAMTSVYDDPGSQATFDAAVTRVQEAIGANSMGLPDEVVRGAQAEAISGLHMARLHRMISDDPSGALKYYEDNRGAFSGKDHVTARQMLDPAITMQKANQWIGARVGTPQAAVDVVNAIAPAVQQVESAGDPTAVSPAGAVGLMQVMPATARGIAQELGYTDIAQMGDDEITEVLKNPEVSKEFGSHYLGQMLQRYGGDLETALIAYNGGPRRADEFLQSGRDRSVLPRETAEYADKVMDAYEGYRNGEGGQPAAKGERVTRYGVATLDTGNRMTAENWQLKNFRPEDLVAPTEGGNWVNAQSAMALDDIAGQFQALTGLRVKVNEERSATGETAGRRRGTSDPKDNPHVGNSQHLHGRAFDIQVQGWTPEQKAQFLGLARQAGFRGIGFYGDNGHLHIDTGRERTWGPMPEWAKAAMSRPATGAASTIPGLPPVAGVAVRNVLNPQGNTGLPQPPIQMDTRGSALAVMEAQALQITDPGVRSLVTQNLSIMQAAETAQRKAEKEQITQGAWAAVLGGQSVMQLDPQVLVRLGREETAGLLAFEKNRAEGGVKQDWKAWSEFSQFTPEQLANTDVYTAFRNKLDDTHFDKALAMQADARKAMQGDAAAALKIEGLQTRQQLVSGTLTSIGLKEDSTEAAQINRMLDAQIAQTSTALKRDLNAVEIQDLLDKLLISNPKTWTTNRGFETTKENVNEFVAAQKLDDIQYDDQQIVLDRYQKMYGKRPEPEDMVDTYNRAMRVYLGGKPTFASDDEQAWFTNGINRGRSTPATPIELEKYYGQWLLSVLGVRPLPGGVR